MRTGGVSSAGLRVVAMVGRVRGRAGGGRREGGGTEGARRNSLWCYKPLELSEISAREAGDQASGDPYSSWRSSARDVTGTKAHALMCTSKRLFVRDSHRSLCS